ncbi:hypothetical protein K435DRAFT_436158 [Dendrothele bispora CBS 962.96]|uniref:G-protein coupled receptors family 1 profile domain-containing protein n=1 Tax=Dendrothele bispora (strain CBS 962.96) TaxID=1314807 RepID=A0A4S8L3G5_DENBC|nr:hypothetical protein K435DRAFT_436158 [Dendrothele bispora CBS 962.96]
MMGSVSQDTTTGDILFMVLVMSIQYFLYGLYTILFVLSIWVLQQSSATTKSKASVKANRLHFTSMIAIFIFTTSTIILHSILNGQLILLNQFQGNTFKKKSLPRVINNLHVATLMVFLTTNLITDLLIIYRMYCIWDKKRNVVLVPLVISVLSHVCGLIATPLITPNQGNLEFLRIQDISLSAFIIINLVNNLVVTFLNVKRIWKINKAAKGISSLISNVRYYTRVITIIIESGILYAVTHIMLLIAVVLLNGWKTAVSAPTTVIPIFLPPLASVPTLIIVQAGMRKKVQMSKDEGAVKVTWQTQLGSEELG